MNRTEMTNGEIEAFMALKRKEQEAFDNTPEQKKISAMYDLSEEQIDRRVCVDSGKYALGFGAMVMKDFKPHSFDTFCRGMIERFKHRRRFRVKRQGWQKGWRGYV